MLNNSNILSFYGVGVLIGIDLLMKPICLSMILSYGWSKRLVF